MITGKKFNPFTGVTTTWHTHEETGKQVEQKTFDATPIIESAALIRREFVQKGALKHAFRFPLSFLYDLRQKGELGEEAFVNGQIVIDMKTAEKLIKKYPAFACVDKL
jgi:hypothetical protein